MPTPISATPAVPCGAGSARRSRASRGWAASRRARPDERKCGEPTRGHRHAASATIAPTARPAPSTVMMISVVVVPCCGRRAAGRVVVYPERRPAETTGRAPTARVWLAATFGKPSAEEVRRMSSHISVPNPTGRLVAEHPGMVKLGRAGWAAKGVVYTIAGVLAATVVFASLGWSSPRPIRRPARTARSRRSPGRPAGPCCCGCSGSRCCCTPRGGLTSALLPGGHDAEAMVKRIGYVVSAVIYTTFAFTATGARQVR